MDGFTFFHGMTKEQFKNMQDYIAKLEWESRKKHYEAYKVAINEINFNEFCKDLEEKNKEKSNSYKER